LVEREGKARPSSVADVTAKTLREAITRAARKSYLMTNEALVYERIGKEFAGHCTVKHSEDEYSGTGGFHHTTVESFFALLKPGIYGNFHHVSEAHLYRFLAGFDFRTTGATSPMPNGRTIFCAGKGRGYFSTSRTRCRRAKSMNTLDSTNKGE
jgi:ISXO2-like transposase domain